jgi:hypothetical protein
MPVETTADRSPRIPPARLWFGAAGAAAAWALQGFTCFTMAVQACKDGTGSWGPLSPVGVRVLIGCVSLAYLAVALASGFVSYRNWRGLSDGRHLMQAEGYGREEYMALVGIFVGLTASVGLIWASMGPIFCNVCTTYR